MILLASSSPRRAELLRLIGVDFVVQPVNLDETPRVSEGPADYVERLAVAKAQTGWQRFAEAQNCHVALGSDTSVTFNGKLFGKPRDQEDHREMISQLAGKEHEVVSAVALTDGQRTEARLCVTRVRLRPMTEEEIASYWRSGEPQDKAGGYAIQGLGSVFVESIQGSFSSVVGLPVYETTALLDNFSVSYWLSSGNR